MPTRITFSAEARAAIAELESRPNDKRAISLLRSIMRISALLQERPFMGDIVPRRLMPSDFEITGTLLRLELPSFWRLLYTVVQEKHAISIIITVIHILDHKEYDKLFGYKKR